ncbi:DNA-binding transcriptional LysR family regulator [Clostridiales Family XIII bacterium PM5-7]
MNINHLRYFDEVCKQGSITKASESCHISQPSITAAINGLEEELGYKLFYRINNRLHLTVEGEAFWKETSEFLKGFADYYEKVCDIAKGRKSLLRLGVPAVMGTFFLKKIIPHFQLAYPNVELEVFEIATLDGIGMLGNGELDLLMGIENNSSYSDCDSKKVFSTELQLAVGTAHPLAKEPVISAEMLSGLPMIIISKGSFHYQAIMDTFADVDLNLSMHSNQLSTIKNMIRDNGLATIIYQDIFAKDPNIHYVPLERPIPAHVHVFWQKHTYLSSGMRSFLSFMETVEF